MFVGNMALVTVEPLKWICGGLILDVYHVEPTQYVDENFPEQQEWKHTHAHSLHKLLTGKHVYYDLQGLDRQ